MDLVLAGSVGDEGYSMLVAVSRDAAGNLSAVMVDGDLKEWTRIIDLQKTQKGCGGDCQRDRERASN